MDSKYFQKVFKTQKAIHGKLYEKLFEFMDSNQEVFKTEKAIHGKLHEKFCELWQILKNEQIVLEVKICNRFAQLFVEEFNDWANFADIHKFIRRQLHESALIHYFSDYTNVLIKNAEIVMDNSFPFIKDLFKRDIYWIFI
eukprot:57047_1